MLKIRFQNYYYKENLSYSSLSNLNKFKSQKNYANLGGWKTDGFSKEEIDSL